MKKGLVLEGGAMRGMYTAGVLDTFMEMGIEFDGIVGVSAGALFGVNFLSNQSGRVIRYCKRFNKDKNYMGLLPLLKEGNVVSREYAYDKVPRIYDVFDDETYKKSTVPFYAAITNMKTGEPEYVQIKSVFEQMDTLRASGSMPFVSRPVKIGNEVYLDGGITDSIPFKKANEMGYDKLVVILTRDMDYKKSPMNKTMVNMFYRKYPVLKEKLMLRYKVYNDSIDELKVWEKEKKAFVIRPSETIEIGRIEKNPHKLQSVYELGIKDAKSVMRDMLSYLEE